MKRTSSDDRIPRWEWVATGLGAAGLFVAISPLLARAPDWAIVLGFALGPPLLAASTALWVRGSRSVLTRHP